MGQSQTEVGMGGWYWDWGLLLLGRSNYEWRHEAASVTRNRRRCQAVKYFAHAVRYRYMCTHALHTVPVRVGTETDIGTARDTDTDTI